jgi:predicted ATPase
VALYAESPGVVCRLYLAWTLWFAGFPDRALKSVAAGLALSQELEHSHSLAFALCFAAEVHIHRREFKEALERAEAAITLASKHGMPQWLGMGMMSRGFALAGLGEHARGIDELCAGFASWSSVGARLSNSQWLGFTAAVHAGAQQYEMALATLDTAVAAIAETGESYFRPELERIRGTILLRLGARDQAEARLRSAVDLARSQGAKSPELRAATSLDRLWAEQGRRSEARNLLAPVYGWFTEGLETADLMDAKTLLEELA